MWQSRAAPRVEVPRPVQLGSLKSENEGQDPGIRLVPAGGGGWGRKKEEDVIEEEEEVPETQNPRLGNLTSQPAQLRPTAWGRSSLSAQAGPRPAPWAQPPPGKVVPEPVPLERRQQEDFPSLGSEPIKGRKSSVSGPSMLSAPVSRPIGAPVPRANLQDRPVAAERREALERREREAAERAAQAARPAPRPPAEKAPEPRPEPRSEKVPSDPEDQADKDKELMKNLADKRRAEKKEEEEERARQQFERAQEKLRLLEKRARERERMEEEERQEQLRALREGPRVQPEPKVSEATPVHEVVEPELPRQMREAPRMEIHVPMPEAPAPRVEVNMPMPEVPEPQEAHMPSSMSSGRRLPPPPMQQPPPPSAPSVVQMTSAPRAPVSVWGDTMAPTASASPAIGGHFPDLGGVPAQSKKDKQKAAFAANLAEPKSSAPSWGQAQRAPPTFTLQELAKPAKKGRSAKVFGGKADADEQALTGAFQQPAPVPGPARAEPQVPEASQVPQAWQGDVARRQEMPRHEGLWEDRARAQEGRSRGKGQGREGTAWQTGDRGDRGDRNARFGRREGREDRRERERNERVPRSEIRLEKRDDGSRRDRDEKDLAEASPSHEEEVRTFKIDPQKPVRILQKSPEEKAKEKAPERVEQPVLKAEDKGKGKASKKGKGQKGRGRGPRIIGEDSDAEWSEASASDEEKPKPGRAELVASEEDSEGGEGTFAASVPKGKGKAKGKNKGKEKAKGAGKKGWVRVEREEKDEEQDEEEEREEIEARLRNSRKVLESRALARAEAERQRRLLREKASLPAPAAPAEPESFQTPESSEHEAEKEEPEEFQEAASEPAELDVADEEPVPDVPDVPDSRPLPELEAEPAEEADEEGVEAAEAELDDSIEVEEMEGDASPLSKEEEAEAEAEDDEEPPVPRGSVLSQEAVHRLNPVADTGLALGIGMVAVQQEAQEEVDSDDLLDFETVKNKTERKAEKQTQRRVKEEHATRAAIRKEAQRQRVRAKEQRETEAAEEKAAEAAAARQAAGPKHEVIKLSDLRRTQPQPQPVASPVAAVEEAQAPVYQVQTDMVYQVRAEAPYPSGKPPPYKPPDVRHLVVSILKANSATMSKPHGGPGGYHPTEPSTYPGHEGKSYGDRDGWETWSPEDWMQDDWEVPIEDPKEERRRQAAAAAAEWNQHRRTRRHAAHGAHATSTWG